MHPPVLQHLADGQPHSGEQLARVLGVTRAAVWKQIGKLEQLGLSIEATRGRGYRLRRPIDLLDRAAIEQALTGSAAAAVERLDLFADIESTNDHLLERPMPDLGRLVACLAEFQRAGRGRRGRRWSAPFGGGLCLSAGWQFDSMPPALATLSLAVGVVVRRALQSLAGVLVGLKWPNDVVFDERKLGGILVDMRAEGHGGCFVVVGIGINVSIAGASLQRLSDWPRGAVDLDAATGGAAPGRSALAAALISGLAELFSAYAARGFAPYRAEWGAADILLDRSIRVLDPAGELSGVARGIDDDGALRLEMPDGRVRRIIAGDVSLRALE